MENEPLLKKARQIKVDAADAWARAKLKKALSKPTPLLGERDLSKKAMLDISLQEVNPPEEYNQMFIATASTKCHCERPVQWSVLLIAGGLGLNSKGEMFHTHRNSSQCKGSVQKVSSKWQGVNGLRNAFGKGGVLTSGCIVVKKDMNVSRMKIPRAGEHGGSVATKRWGRLNEGEVPPLPLEGVPIEQVGLLAGARRTREG